MSVRPRRLERAARTASDPYSMTITTLRVDVEAGRRARSAVVRHCLVCGNSTREYKDYCSDHVENQPYVAALTDLLERQAREDERVSTQGVRAVNIYGVTARDIILHLDVFGARTMERLSRELRIPMVVLGHYVQKFHKKKMIALGTTKRGSQTAKLSGKFDFSAWHDKMSSETLIVVSRPTDRIPFRVDSEDEMDQALEACDEASSPQSTPTKSTTSDPLLEYQASVMDAASRSVAEQQPALVQPDPNPTLPPSDSFAAYEAAYAEASAEPLTTQAEAQAEPCERVVTPVAEAQFPERSMHSLGDGGAGGSSGEAGALAPPRAPTMRNVDADGAGGSSDYGGILIPAGDTELQMAEAEYERCAKRLRECQEDMEKARTALEEARMKACVDEHRVRPVRDEARLAALCEVAVSTCCDHVVQVSTGLRKPKKKSKPNKKRKDVTPDAKTEPQAPLVLGEEAPETTPSSRPVALLALGAKIRNARIRSGLSQEDVAKKFRVSVDTVIKWELGKVQAPSGVVASLSAV